MCRRHGLGYTRVFVYALARRAVTSFTRSANRRENVEHECHQKPVIRMKAARRHNIVALPTGRQTKLCFTFLPVTPRLPVSRSHSHFQFRVHVMDLSRHRKIMSREIYFFSTFPASILTQTRAHTHQGDHFRFGINQANGCQTNIRFTAVKANQLRSSRFATFDTARPDAAQIQKVFEWIVAI